MWRRRKRKRKRKRKQAKTSDGTWRITENGCRGGSARHDISRVPASFTPHSQAKQPVRFGQRVAKGKNIVPGQIPMTSFLTTRGSGRSCRTNGNNWFPERRRFCRVQVRRFAERRGTSQGKLQRQRDVAKYRPTSGVMGLLTGPHCYAS
jgi:hypothetical protein